MVGIPGSGKSFFASKFAETFNAPYIDSLAIEALAKDDESAGAMIAMLVTEIAKTNQTFLFEGNSDSRVRRTEFTRWARAHGYVPLLVWVQTDQSTSKARTLKAGSLAEDAFIDIVKDFSPPHPDEKPVVISGKHTFATQVKVILAHLGRYNRPDQSVVAGVNPGTARPTQPITVR